MTNIKLHCKSGKRLPNKKSAKISGEVF